MLSVVGDFRRARMRKGLSRVRDVDFYVLGSCHNAACRAAGECY